MTQEEHAEELHLRYKVAEKTKQYARLLDYCGLTEDAKTYRKTADYEMQNVRLSWGKF